MATLPQPANTEENHSTGGFDLLPEGDYIVAIEKADWKDTKAGTGKYINMQFNVIEGEKQGSKLFNILNLVNPNPVAVRIATQDLNKICAACNMSNVEDTDELIGIPMSVTVTIDENEGSDYPAQNKIIAYNNADGDSFEAPWD